MKPDKQRLREIRVQIRTVLMNEWDPIGVRGVPQAYDEYDGYIGGVYELLHARASEHQVAAYLLEIERESMGLDFRKAEDLLSVARSLLRISVEAQSN